MDHQHRAEPPRFRNFDLQIFPGGRLQNDFEIGNGDQHSIRRRRRFSVATILHALAERGGNGLRDAFDKRGFNHFSVGDSKITFRKIRGRRRRFFIATGQRVDEAHRRALRDQVFNRIGHGQIFVGAGCVASGGFCRDSRVA